LLLEEGENAVAEEEGLKNDVEATALDGDGGGR